MQFENILEPIHTRTYLLTLHKPLADTYWTCQSLCVYNHSNYRFEEITPCLTNDRLEKLKEDLFIELNALKVDEEIS